MQSNGMKEKRERGLVMKKNSKSTKNIAYKLIKTGIFALLFLILIVGAKKGFEFGEQVFSEKGCEKRPGSDVEVVIENGDSKMEVADKMVSYGLAKSKWVFYAQSLLYNGKYTPGTFMLNTSESPEKLIQTLSEKPTEKDAESVNSQETKATEQATTEQATTE